MMTREEALQAIGETLRDLIVDNAEAMEVLGLLAPAKAAVKPERIEIPVDIETGYWLNDVHALDREAEAPKIKAAIETDAAAYGEKNYKDVVLMWGAGDACEAHTTLWCEALHGGLDEYSYEPSDAAQEAMDADTDADQEWKDADEQE